MSDLTALSASEAAAKVSSGDIDPAELLDAWRARAQSDDLNAYLHHADGPSDATDTGELGGVPVAVKDLFCIEDMPSTAASKILEGYRPPYTSTVVERVRAAGAPTLGKTNMDEFAMGSSNENSAYGPVKNPWDETKVPGGSSGGSAAAVAAGLAPWALGTDTGGSIRQPAAFCGIVGLKPTYGAVSRYGMIAFASSLDQAGTLARDTTDCALLTRSLVAADPRDSTSTGTPGPIELPTAERLDGVTIGVPRSLIGEGVEPGVLEVFEDTLKRAQELGATITDVELPHCDHAIAAYYVIAPAEASANLSRFDGVRYGQRRMPDQSEPGEALIGMYEATREQGFGDEVKRRILIGTYALSSGYYDAYYGKAQKVRRKIAEDFATVFEGVDLIATPTAPSTAYAIGEKSDDPLAMYLGDVFTVPMSLAGIPGASIPAGLSDGLPVGFQLTGPAFSENAILDAAHALEGAIGFEEHRNAAGLGWSK